MKRGDDKDGRDIIDLSADGGASEAEKSAEGIKADGAAEYFEKGEKYVKYVKDAKDTKDTKKEKKKKEKDESPKERKIRAAYNVLFVFLALLILLAAAASSFAASGILKTGYGEREYGEKINCDLTLNDGYFFIWKYYDDSLPTLGEVLKTEPEKIADGIKYPASESDGSYAESDGNGEENVKAAALREMFDSNLYLCDIAEISESVLNVAPPRDGENPFANPDKTFDFLSERVQVGPAHSELSDGTNLYFLYIRDYRYRADSGEEFVLNAAVCGTEYYFCVTPAEEKPMSIMRAVELSEKAVDWVYPPPSSDERIYTYDVDSGAGYEISKVPAANNPVFDFFYTALEPLFISRGIEARPQNYICDNLHDCTRFLTAYGYAARNFPYFASCSFYDGKLLISPAFADQNYYRLIYDDSIGKVCGFYFTSYETYE